IKYEEPEEIRQRTYKFAVRVVKLCRALPREQINNILIGQVVRSATSIGANLEEAKGSHTRAEFINCTNIAKKEARETYYWLKMISEINTELIKIQMEDIISEANEIVSILTASVKKLQMS